jgi:hypothetical protein
VVWGVGWGLHKTRQLGIVAVVHTVPINKLVGRNERCLRSLSASNDIDKLISASQTDKRFANDYFDYRVKSAVIHSTRFMHSLSSSALSTRAMLQRKLTSPGRHVDLCGCQSDVAKDDSHPSGSLQEMQTDVEGCALTLAPNLLVASLMQPSRTSDSGNLL